MGTYEDVDWAWLRALTRERRRQRATNTLPSWALQPGIAFGRVVRYYAGRSYEFEARCALPGGGGSRSKSPSKWRRRQWAAGNRSCGYCGVECLVDVPDNHPRLATTDHRHPKALYGPDEPSNYLMACKRCNNRKGHMTEAEFRALLEAERLAEAA